MRALRIAKLPLWTAIAVVLVAAIAYLGVTLFLARHATYSINELLVPRLMDLLVTAWFFGCGSSIGSFLNVVAWRMPRRRSINGHSACPFCSTPIRFYDNIPVWGWLKLGGRCRSCHLPIAPRYPIVEAIVGLSFTVLGLAGVYSGGANLPGSTARFWQGGPLAMPVIDGPLIAINLYHAMALMGAWAFALVRFDSHRLPGRLVAFYVTIAAGAMLAWPPLQRVPWQLNRPKNPFGDPRLSTLLYLVTSLVVAVMLARIFARSVCPSADPKVDPLGKDTGRLMDLIAMLSLPSIVLGWHAMIALAMFATLCAITLGRCFPQRNSYIWLMMSVPIAMTAMLAAWRPLSELAWFPAPDHSPQVIMGWLLAVLVSAQLLKSPKSLVEASDPQP